MPSGVNRRAVIEAVGLARAGNREAAHEIVAGLEQDTAACWLHACLHKIEGDEENARYWYRRSGQFYESYQDPQAELAAIAAALTY